MALTFASAMETQVAQKEFDLDKEIWTIVLDKVKPTKITDVDSLITTWVTYSNFAQISKKHKEIFYDFIKLEHDVIYAQKPPEHIKVDLNSALLISLSPDDSKHDDQLTKLKEKIKKREINVLPYFHEYATWLILLSEAHSNKQ